MESRNVEVRGLPRFTVGWDKPAAGDGPPLRSDFWWAGSPLSQAVWCRFAGELVPPYICLGVL